MLKTNKKRHFFISSFILFSILLSPFICQADDTYVYDDLNRLEKVIYDNDTVIIYSYDDVGNRITKELNELCRGDLNDDGIVNLSDFNIFNEDWLRTDCSAVTPCASDLNDDGIVNLSDFNIFNEDWLRTDCPII